MNAAGLNTRQAADDVTLEGWQATLDLNLSTPFFLAQALVPAMKKKGWGRILNIASLQSERAFPGGISYGASKGGISQLTRAMRQNTRFRRFLRFNPPTNPPNPVCLSVFLAAPVYDAPCWLAFRSGDTECGFKL